MPKFTVRKGKRYSRGDLARLASSRFASNDMVAAAARGCRLHRGRSQGLGGTEREAKALWPLEDATADIPHEIGEIVEIDVTKLAQA